MLRLIIGISSGFSLKSFVLNSYWVFSGCGVAGLMSTSTMGSGVVGSSITGPDFELQTVVADITILFSSGPGRVAGQALHYSENLH
ncbi:hypothetical protein Tco_0196692 [Tanacetum coccineum]